MDKRKLLVISHVIPCRPVSGQQQRVYQMISRAREYFDVSFLTFCKKDKINQINTELTKLTDRFFILESQYDKSIFTKIWYSFCAFIFRFLTGQKKSNFLIGEVELNNKRISTIVNSIDFDLVIYEYWHAWKSLSVFKKKNTAVLLDMHDILNSSYAQQLKKNQHIPHICKQRMLNQYKKTEQLAWSEFDGIIAINQNEMNEVKSLFPEKDLFYCPMGIDLEHWKYSYSPKKPVRFGFYGGFGSEINQRFAFYTAKEIMPYIWKSQPDTELWLVGNNPPDAILKLSDWDHRITVTGFLPDPRETLSSFLAVFCPWEGVFGFRSRLIEIMAIGIPVIASPDAIVGMGFHEDKSLLCANSAEEFASKGIGLSNNPDRAIEISREARHIIENQYGLNNTYDHFFKGLESWLNKLKIY